MDSVPFYTLQYKNQVLVIDGLGASLCDYYLLDGDKRVNICFGYDKDRKKKEASMGNVLAPFPGRVLQGFD